MYMGVKNHHDLPRVTSYADAERALATWEQRRKRGTEVVDVRREIDNAIHFRLYSTDVVVWYLDDSVEIDNYGTVTTSQFAHRFLPASIHLHYPVVRRGSSGGANTIGYTGRDEDGKHVYALCQGDVVRFCGTLDGRWVPDLDTCYDITLPVGVDRKQSRKLARELHFAEFETWLAMAPMHLGDVEHDFWDLHECMSALKDRDWRRAAEHLPTIKESDAFGHTQRARPLDIATSPGEYISLACLSKLKLAIWDWHNLLDVETRKTWPRAEFDRRMARVREMEALGLNTHGMGPLT